MKDETYVYIHDVKDKKFTARSANKKRTHTGKGGRVRLPSDNLSKKELQKMNGECKSFKLNSPMTWNEFMSMPDDIKITYIKLLREKFDVTDAALYKMFGTNKDSLSRTLLKLGLRVPKRNAHREWKKEEWFAWVNGVDKLPTPVIEEPVQEEAEPVTAEEPEAVVEEDIPCIQLDSNRAEEVLKRIHPSLADLEAELMKAKCENEWLRNECESQRIQVRILEAQMEVVRLIFGGIRNGN